MSFPYIAHIDQILPLIDGRDEFIHVVKDGYQVIDYVYEAGDSFDEPLLRECRGIKFDSEGWIIARPLHKFFNYGQKLITYDWNEPHVIMTKMDGSMVHTAIINGELRLCTRMGLTDQALAAEKLLTPVQREILRRVTEIDATVILEYTAPDNRIVIEYDKPALTLLAIRRTSTGYYIPYKDLKSALVTSALDIPLVEVHDIRLGDDNIASIRENTKGIEGYVVAWLDGTRTKIKTDEYCQMHRAVSYFDRESMILPVVLDMQCDDLYPSLSLDRVQRLQEYEAAVLREFNGYCGSVQIALDTYKESGMSRKDYALFVTKTVPKGLQGVFFAAIDGKSIPEAVKAGLIRNPELLSVRW